MPAPECWRQTEISAPRQSTTFFSALIHVFGLFDESQFRRGKAAHCLIDVFSLFELAFGDGQHIALAGDPDI